jgi:hypothetical protein
MDGEALRGKVGALAGPGLDEPTGDAVPAADVLEAVMSSAD